MNHDKYILHAFAYKKKKKIGALGNNHKSNVWPFLANSYSCKEAETINAIIYAGKIIEMLAF